jgi:anti-sigma regulatory factor (Ser/Thr protein kinase)
VGALGSGSLIPVEAFAIEKDLAGGIDAPRRVRGLIRDELEDRIPSAVLGDVALLVTELVANGVRHGGAHDGRSLHVRLEGRPPALRVEVTDPGRTRDGIGPRPLDLEHDGGLGLQIVDRVASRWGVRDGAATTVWFELDLG